MLWRCLKTQTPPFRPEEYLRSSLSLRRSTGRHLVVPRLQRVEFRRNVHLHTARCKVDRHQRRDVGRREFVTRHERRLLETIVEVGKEVGHTQLAALDDLRNLLVSMRT